jgi:hypothetical protein
MQFAGRVAYLQFAGDLPLHLFNSVSEGMGAYRRGLLTGCLPDSMGAL